MTRYFDNKSTKKYHEGGQDDAALFEAKGHRENRDANDGIGHGDDGSERHAERRVVRRVLKKRISLRGGVRNRGYPCLHRCSILRGPRSEKSIFFAVQRSHDVAVLIATYASDHGFVKSVTSTRTYE